MSSEWIREFVGAAIAFALAAASMPVVRRLGRWLGITAAPALDKSKALRIPATGGVSIVAATIVALAVVGSLPHWLVFGAVALCAAGLIDDAIVLAPRQKLIAQIVIVACAAAVWLPKYTFTGWPLADLVITIFWLTAATNAFNLIDGLDGLAGGVGFIAAGAIAVVGFAHEAPGVAAPSLILCGTLAGFLIYNYPPASIIMGDAGALPVGYLLGVLALEGARLATNSAMTIAVFPILIMLVPLLDMATVMVARTTAGKAISARRLDHIHDRLLALGLADRQIAAAAWASAVVAAGCAIEASRLPRETLVIALPFITLAAAVITLFTIDLAFDDASPADAHSMLPGPVHGLLPSGYTRLLAEAAMDLILIAAAYCGAAALRLDFNLNQQVLDSIISGLPWVTVLTYPAFLAAGVYRGLWHRIGLADVFRFAFGATLAGLLVALGSIFLPIRHSGSIAVLYAILLGNLLVATRSSFVLLQKFINRFTAVTDRVLVVGSGAAGTAAANFVLQTRPRSARLVGFADADRLRQGKLVEGWRVLGQPDELEQIYGRVPFTEVLVADANLSSESLEALQRFARIRQIPVRRFSINLDEIPESPPHNLHASAPNSSPSRRRRA